MAREKLSDPGAISNGSDHDIVIATKCEILEVSVYLDTGTQPGKYIKD